MKGSTVVLVGVFLWVVAVVGFASLVKQGNKGCQFFDETMPNLTCK